MGMCAIALHGRFPLLFNQFPRACSYFDGRRRKMQMTVKGRFLTPNVSYDTVLTGEGTAFPLCCNSYSLPFHQRLICPWSVSVA